jgi:hypothetical protein
LRRGSAAEAKAADGGKLLDAVRAEARDDLGYVLCRLHWLTRNDTPGSNAKDTRQINRSDLRLIAGG